MKYFGINLTKIIQDLYEENYKTGVRLKVLNKRYSAFMDKNAVLSRYQFISKWSIDSMQTQSKIPASCFVGVNKLILKFTWSKRPRIGTRVPFAPHPCQYSVSIQRIFILNIFLIMTFQDLSHCLNCETNYFLFLYPISYPCNEAMFFKLETMNEESESVLNAIFNLFPLTFLPLNPSHCLVFRGSCQEFWLPE